MARRIATMVLALCGSLIWGDAALAGGFELPGFGVRAMGRGGAFTVRADDLTAMHHNPSGLLRNRGTRFLYNHNLTFSKLEFTKAPSAVESEGYDQLDNPGTLQSELFPLGVTLGLGSDFGLEDWSFAVGIFGPNGIGELSFPEDGGQRYMLTNLETALIFFTGSVAYGRRDHWGIGISLQYVWAPYARLGLVVDARPANAPGLQPNISGYDVVADFDLSDDFSFSAIVGGWWRVHPAFEIGFSSRVIPAVLDLSGPIDITPIGEIIADDEVIQENTGGGLELTLPAFVRAGVRYRHLTEAQEEIFDIEVDVVWEHTSSLDNYDIDLEGRAQIPGVFNQELPDISLPRRWQDTFSIRMGGTWNAIADTLEVSAGGFWESGAAPKNYSHIDFPAFQRGGLGTGLTYRFYGVSLSVSYLHIFQETRRVDERFAKVYQVRPISPCDENPNTCNGSTTGVPANAGKFVSSFNLVGLGLELHFDEWFE